MHQLLPQIDEDEEEVDDEHVGDHDPGKRRTAHILRDGALVEEGGRDVILVTQ